MGRGGGVVCGSALDRNSEKPQKLTLPLQTFLLQTVVFLLSRKNQLE